MTLSGPEIHAIVRGEHGDPFAVLGPCLVRDGETLAIAVRTFQPGAAAVRVIPVGATPEPRPAERIHSDGLFEAVFPSCRERFPYRLEVVDGHDRTVTIDDPYRFAPTLSAYDLHLLGEGTHYKAYEKMGAHLRVIDGAPGVAFAVWAPNARRVSVVGDFNGWDGRRHPMRLHPGNGIWEIFIPGLDEGARYKFEILARSGEPLALEADPYAFTF